MTVIREAIVIVRNAGVAGISDLVERIARSGAPLLILGERGVGKEVFARSVHAVSQRQGDFVVVRCADRRPFLFQATGTMLLDEIGEMPLDVQDALLRALELRPCGARVIATSRHVPSRLVTRGSLRGELLRQLNGITLELLPLRERRTEIVDLAQELLVEAVRETSLPTTRFTASALATFLHYDWPGNMRELQRVVARAALLAGAAPIEAHHLLLARGSKVRGEVTVPLAHEEFRSVARAHDGNASAIARTLHTSRSQVRRLASRYEVDLDQLRRVR